MNRQPFAAITLILLLMAALAACNGGVELSEKQPPLVDTEWRLTSLNGHDLIPGTYISLTFDDESLSGFAGCNFYGGGPDGGAYTATAQKTLSISQIAITAMACLEPEDVMAQETAYVEALRDATAYRILGDHLEIEDAAGNTTLVFNRIKELPMDPSDLVGTEWRLISLNGVAPHEEAIFVLVFTSETQITGQAGCRTYAATYEAEGDEMNVFFMEMMGQPCLEEEAIMDQEGEYTTILGWTSRYRLGERELTIFSARGETLTFESLPADEAPTHAR